MKSFAKAASTSRTERVFLQDSTSTTGAGLAGLTFATSGLTWYYIRSDQATATAITPVTMTVGTWVSAGFKEIDATNMPGWYEVGLPNAAIASGRSVQMMIQGAANLSPHPFEIEVTAVDFQSATLFMTSVGSVTGNVGGSVLGNVAGSVLGSVGSVSGLTTSTITTSVVAGMASSPVGTVTGGVIVTTNNDKTGYGLAATQAYNHTGQTTKYAVTLAAGDVTGNLPADIQTIKAQAVAAAAGVTFPASIGTGTSTYAGADTAGTTTLLTRIPGVILANGSGFTAIPAVTVGGYSSGQDPATLTATRFTSLDASAALRTGFILAPSGLDAISSTPASGIPSTFREKLMWGTQRLGLGRVVLDRNALTLTVYVGASVATVTHFTATSGVEDFAAVTSS